MPDKQEGRRGTQKGQNSNKKREDTGDELYYVDLMEEGLKHAFMKILVGLASTMQKVIVNIKKFPFT